MRYLALFVAFVPIVASAQAPGVLGPGEIDQLEAKLAQNPADRGIQTTLGRNYAFAILGITTLGQYDRVTGMDPARAGSALAQHARVVFQSSTNAGVLAEGGRMLWRYANEAQSYSLLTLRTEKTFYAEAALGVTALDRAITLDPKTADWRSYRIPITTHRANFQFVLPLEVARAYAIVKEDMAVLKGGTRVYSLADAAKLAVRASALDDAEAFGRELLTFSSKDWNEGNALYFGNMILGQVVLRRDDVVTAIGYLLASGRTPGSPQLNSFGPNMTLAKELLETKNDAAREAVLEFFGQCAGFWKLDRGQLKRWSEVVRGGGTPDFGANLVY
jgi:hypothetical protein